MTLLPRQPARNLLLALVTLTLSSSLAHAFPTLLDTVDLSPGADAGDPFLFGLNANTHKLYVFGSGGDSLTSGLKIIDTTTGSVSGGIATDPFLSSIGYGSVGQVLVDDSATAGGNRVYLIGAIDDYNDPSKNHVIIHFIDTAAETNLPGDLLLTGSAYTGVAQVNPVTHKLYVVDHNENLFIVDGPNQKLLSEKSFPLTVTTTPVANRTADKVIFLGSNTMVLLDGSTDALTSTAVPFTSPTSAVLDQANQRLYILATDAQTSAQTLYALDANSGTVLASTTNGIPMFSSLAFDAVSNTVYVGLSSSSDPTTETTIAYNAATLALNKKYSFGASTLAFDSGRLFFLGGSGATYGYEGIDNAVGILDPATVDVSKTTVAYQPGPLALDSSRGRIYGIDEVANEVFVLDAVNQTVIGRFPILNAALETSTTFDVRSLAVSPALNIFYVMHTANQTVNGDEIVPTVFVDGYAADSGLMLLSIPLGATGSYATDGYIAVDDVHSRIYAASTSGSDATGTQHAAIYVVDSQTNAGLATIPVGVSLPNGLAVNPVTQRVYVSSGSDTSTGTVYIIDGATNTVVKTVKTTTGVPGSIAVNTKTNKVYVANFVAGDITLRNSINIIDGATDTSLGTFPNVTAAGQDDSAFNVAVNEADNTVYVADRAFGDDPTGRVTIFDGNNNYAFLGQVELGKFPTGIVFDPATQRLFVSNDYDGTVSVLQEPILVVTPTVTVKVAGDGMAVEGGEKGKVFFSRTGDITKDLTVFYKVKGVAKAGVDYKALAGSVVIPAGASRAKVKLKPIDNATHDGTRGAKFKLLPAPDGSYNVGDPAVAKVKVIDND